MCWLLLKRGNDFITMECIKITKWLYYYGMKDGESEILSNYLPLKNNLMIRCSKKSNNLSIHVLIVMF